MSEDKPLRPNKDQRELRDRLFADPTTMDTVCAHVANGGTLITLTDTWGIPFGWVSNWIHADKDRNSRYIAALNDRAEWGKERVLQELRLMGLFDIKKVFNEDGSIKPPTEWPEEISRAVTSLEVDELFEGTGRDRELIGQTKKVKFTDKNRALELLGKNLSLFVERHEHTVRTTLADIVAGANEDETKKIEGES